MRSARTFFQWAALCVVLFASGCGLDWRESYDYTDDDPFDLYVLHQLLQARDGGLTMLQDSLPALSADEEEVANYVFVGSYAYYNENEITHLLDFVERGNNAFIAADELPEELAEMLYGSDCYFNYDEYDYSTTYDDDYSIRPGYHDTVQLTLETAGEPYQLVHVYDWKPTRDRVNFVPDYHLCDPEIDNVSLGTVDTNFIGYVRLNWGKGNFYFNTQPKFFTNFYLVDSTSYHYAEDALAIALNDGPIYWDEASRIPPAVARQKREARNRPARQLTGRNLLSGNESLSYIQDNPALALAWYLLLASVLLYVFFRGKRRQRIIPIINQRENSSKRFIDTLSRLIYQKGNHGALARQELRSLRFHLQDKFGIRWQPSEPLPKNFAELTGASATLIEGANIEIKIVHDKRSIDETALVRFYRAIEPIYHL
ncbi:DUF4350 domain-containing protein [Lewinella sp. 4G2]|uniref:DUF4350 domain-containing protein n=1 Tax=Lewinella sp. 4G2 TaxID=1803372 RepID=UPI0007B494AF|nr:DUF4350 domain-containing protein [Lewinella sp. 4G2]OAV43552.1 hypothetical protein A3850_003150 [Lewinella sp. 4G2]